jgi:hypothetical protein
MPSQLQTLLGKIRRKPTQASDGRSAEASSGIQNHRKTGIVSDITGLGVKNAKFALDAITTLASGEPPPRAHGMLIQWLIILCR